MPERLPRGFGVLMCELPGTVFVLVETGIVGAFHLVKISGIFGSAVNGTRFVGSSHWKIPRKSGKFLSPNEWTVFK